MMCDVTHWMLVMAPDFGRSRAQVERFFRRTTLVRYDRLQVVEEESCQGSSPHFSPALAQGIAENRLVLARLLAELATAGVRELAALPTLPQGAQSKILHTVAHLLDGFFGIDSRLYNLVEDSHWLSPGLERQLGASPEDFWLVKVVGSLIAPERGPVFGLRPFEKEPSQS